MINLKRQRSGEETRGERGTGVEGVDALQRNEAEEVSWSIFPLCFISAGPAHPQTAENRFLCVQNCRDPDPGSVFSLNR